MELDINNSVLMQRVLFSWHGRLGEVFQLASNSRVADGSSSSWGFSGHLVPPRASGVQRGGFLNGVVHPLVSQVRVSKARRLEDLCGEGGKGA